MKKTAEVKIVPATEDDSDVIMEFLQKYFFPEEPLNSSLKRCPEKNATFLNNLRAGLCFKAINLLENPEDNLIGVVMNKEVTYADSLKSRTPDCSKHAKIIKLLEELDKKAKIWERVNNENHVEILAISVNEKYRGLGIGQKLVEESLKLAKSRNYNYVAVECSSFYSARFIKEMGFEFLAEIPYDQYLNENMEPVFKVKKPHEAIKKFLKKL